MRTFLPPVGRPTVVRTETEMLPYSAILGDPKFRSG